MPISSPEPKSVRVGPKLAWDDDLICKMRTIVRKQVDRVWAARVVERQSQQRTEFNSGLKKYRTLVRKFVRESAKKAKRNIPELEDCACAASLLSGVSNLWSPRGKDQRITCITTDKSKLPNGLSAKSAQNLLDDCVQSPVHVFCEISHEKRPLWVRLEKPIDFQVLNLTQNEKVIRQLRQTANEVDSPGNSISTFNDALELLIKKDKFIRKRGKQLRTLAAFLDCDELYGAFFGDKEISKDQKYYARALIDTWVAFSVGTGKFLWMFGFDADRPPSPSRVVAIATDDENAEAKDYLRRWLNVLAAILGDVVAAERSISVFIRSMQSRGLIVKRDMKRSATLEAAQRSYWFVSDWESKPDLEKDDSEALSGVLALLPPLRSIIAQKHSVISMPSYRAPTLREVLLANPFRIDSETAAHIIRGVLKRVFSTFYSLSEEACKKEFNISNCREWQLNYFRTRYVQRFRERVNKTIHLIRQLEQQSIERKSDSEHDSDDLSLLESIKTLLSTKRVNVTYRYANTDEPFRSVRGVREFSNKNERWSHKPKPIVNALEIFELLDRECERKSFQFLLPTRPWLIHGDLHFDNILIDPNDLDDPIFKLIDYNIHREGGDIAYDLGKFFHSCDGLYDLIHEGLFKIHCAPFVRTGVLDEDESDALLDITVGTGAISGVKRGGGSGAEVIEYVHIDDQLKVYRAINSRLDKDIQFVGRKILRHDKNWETRAKLAQATHFLTMAPFHIEENVSRALVILATGMMLLTEWCLRKEVCTKVSGLKEVLEKNGIVADE